jgi:hypothetical protein
MSQPQQQHHVRRRRPAGTTAAGDDNDPALHESLLHRSSSSSGGGRDADADANATAGPLIVRPRPLSVVAFLSAVVQRWLTALLALIGGQQHHRPATTTAAPTSAATAPTTVAGARRVAAAASSADATPPGFSHLRAALAEPYLPEDSAHQAALVELWRLAFGTEGPAPPAEPSADAAPVPRDALRSPLWQQMGWQGLDPATDFRGAGRFGLENLLVLGRSRPRLFDALLHKRRGTRSAWEYPFAVAGLNLTFALGDVLGVVGGARVAGGGNAPRTAAARAFAAMVEREQQAAAGADGSASAPSASASAAASAERAFSHAYAAAFALLDAVWLERKAGYMEFGAVMADTKARLATAVARCGGEREEEEKCSGKVARALAGVFGSGAARRPGGAAQRRQPSSLPAATSSSSGPITARDLARAAGLVDEEVLAML